MTLKARSSATSATGTFSTIHRPPTGRKPLSDTSNGSVETFPELHLDIKRMIAEGDLVVTHSHLENYPDDRGTAVVDLFRVENGKIVEHWDVLQPIPEQAANDNTMF